MGTYYLSENSTGLEIAPKLQMIASCAQLKQSKIGSKLAHLKGQEACPFLEQRKGNATQGPILTGKKFIFPFS